jgi:hypothetical protein
MATGISPSRRVIEPELEPGVRCSNAPVRSDPRMGLRALRADSALLSGRRREDSKGEHAPPDAPRAGRRPGIEAGATGASADAHRCRTQGRQVGSRHLAELPSIRSTAKAAKQPAVAVPAEGDTRRGRQLAPPRLRESPSPMSSVKRAFPLGLMGLTDGAAWRCSTCRDSVWRWRVRAARVTA